MLCIAISNDSETIAVGQRVRYKHPKSGQMQHIAAVQLYSSDLVPRSLLRCRSAKDRDFPKNLSFFPDGQTLLYSTNRTFGVWTQKANNGITEWHDSSLGVMDAKVRVK